MASLKSMSVAVEIGEPILFGDSTTPEVMQLAHERVQELVNQARARLEPPLT